VGGGAGRWRRRRERRVGTDRGSGPPGSTASARGPGAQTSCLSCLSTCRQTHPPPTFSHMILTQSVSLGDPERSSDAKGAADETAADSSPRLVAAGPWGAVGTRPLSRGGGRARQMLVSRPKVKRASRRPERVVDPPWPTATDDATPDAAPAAAMLPAARRAAATAPRVSSRRPPRRAAGRGGGGGGGGGEEAGRKEGDGIGVGRASRDGRRVHARNPRSLRGRARTNGAGARGAAPTPSLAAAGLATSAAATEAARRRRSPAWGSGRGERGGVGGSVVVGGVSCGGGGGAPLRSAPSLSSSSS